MELWVLILPLWLGVASETSACFTLLGGETGLELHLTLEGYPDQGGGGWAAPRRGNFTPIFLVT